MRNERFRERDRQKGGGGILVSPLFTPFERFVLF